MGVVKRYFKKEFSANTFFMNHDNTMDFDLTCCQRNRSVLPLLFLRIIIFVGCAGTVIASMIMTAQASNIGSWFIFLTHWGLIFNLIASIFALIVSLMALSKGSDANDEGLRLPWYTKTYWIFINIATPIAFFITIFYWIFLSDLGTDGASSINIVLDLFIHLVNSLLMLALVLVSRHPARVLHFYWPVGVAIIYMIFTIIFHFAGGLSPFGTSYIYPMLNWDEPGITVVVVLGSALGLIIMQILVVIITFARDKLTRSCRGSKSIPISKQGPISYNQM